MSIVRFLGFKFHKEIGLTKCRKMFCRIKKSFAFAVGHYVAYCRNEFDKNWYEYDDSLVTRVSALEVMNKEVYVMFYQKKNSDEMDDIRAQCQDLLRYSMRVNY